ncbi:MAG: hypothetical protein ABT20_18205 [Rubrivivax sp. SCN 70-15]|nr:MAG: hypothetical protein ABT20_18205 [Rubrivivax sp. SCN 70-15]
MNARTLRRLVAMALVALVPWLARAETFDLVSFTPPPGARSTQADAVGFTDATPTTFAIYGVYRSAPGSGDAARDFADEWAMLVARSLRVTGDLKTETRDWPGGWKLTMGAARVWSEQARQFVALLSVFTGHGVKVSVLVNYNDDLYRPKIDRFLASLRLAPPEPAAAPGAPPSVTPPSPGPSAAANPSFTFTVPGGFVERGGWYVAARTENRGGGDEITSALVRVLPAVAAQGGMSETLRALWRGHVPEGLRERGGAMVYRRYVGDGVPAWFISGRGREAGRQADSLFTLYLLDCGASWQPLLVAQTYEEPGNPVAAAAGFSAGSSYGTSASMAEPFLATLRCAGGKGRPLADRAALAGDYGFGSSGSQMWVNVYTGATSMTAVSYGGRLALKADGSYAYEFAGAHGVVGAMNVQTDRARGRWDVHGDLLVLTRDDGRSTRYRIAGVTQFPGGAKGAVFMSRLDLPVNPTTVTNGGDYYATR